MQTLRGKVVVITGAGGAIAGAVAEAFFESGATPALVDRDRLRVQGRANTFRGAAVESSLATLREAEAAMAAVAERQGAIHALVHLVGERATDPLESMSEEAFDTVMDSNVRTLFLATKAVLPYLRAQGDGFIGGIASKGGWMGGVAGGAPNAVAFAAAKGAVGAFLHALDRELASTNIQVGICYPMGAVDTNENRRALGRAGDVRLIDPKRIGEAFVAAALSGVGGRLVEFPVHPPR
jgi:NAD(P)-dependent dehydrogenase (short-subunit alcohol dehydrogenase family)